MANDNMNVFIMQLNELINTDKAERAVFSSLTASISDRIFNYGEDANGNPIGQYSKNYVEQRIKNNWGSSRKVILQFTGQMKNDFGLIRDGNNYGAGFKNNANGDKSRAVEKRFDKKIFTASPEESNLAEELYGTELKRIIG